MKTYSDKVIELRKFLEEKKAEPLFLRSGVDYECWLIDGKEIIVRLEDDGSWKAFIPAGPSDKVVNQLTDLNRFLSGPIPNLDLIVDIGNIAALMKDKIQILPGCTDPECGQGPCKNLRDLNRALDLLIGRISPISKIHEGTPNVRT